MEDILLEMDHISCSEGMVIICYEVDVVNKVKRMTSGMRGNMKMLDHEDSPLVPEKILIAV